MAAFRVLLADANITITSTTAKDLVASTTQTCDGGDCGAAAIAVAAASGTTSVMLGGRHPLSSLMQLGCLFLNYSAWMGSSDNRV